MLGLSAALGECPLWVRRCRCRCRWRGRLVSLVDGMDVEDQAELAEVMLSSSGTGERMQEQARPSPSSRNASPPSAQPEGSTSRPRRVPAPEPSVPSRAEGSAPGSAPAATQDGQPTYVELPGRPEAYCSVEAAMLMSVLPHERWTFNYVRDADNGEGDAECRVCLSDYQPDEEIVRLPCMHYAHTRCIEEWLVRSPKCPVCRSSIPEMLNNDGTY
mmetsp:Transcript_55946/g.121079  ORF Transcript_55946/g.121079 Transcript_55946/m.121079 type:complete len:216 (-) Transcript_55946:86-733(-)